MGDGQPQVPVEKICGAMSSQGRLCLKIKGHKNWWHQHGNNIWQSSEPTPWTVSEKLRDALNEATTQDVRRLANLVALDVVFPRTAVRTALQGWLDEIATIKENDDG